MQNGCGSTEKGQKALQTRSQFYNNTSIWKKKQRKATNTKENFNFNGS